MAVPVEVLDYRHALIVPGQGSQREKMGQDLALAVPEAMDTWLQVNRALGYEVSKIAWTQPLAILTETQNAQVLISVDASARANALEATGQSEVPGWHTGQSLGLVVAAMNVGSLSLEDAVSLALERGAIFKEEIRRNPKATMTSLMGAALEHREVLEKRFGLYVCLTAPGETIQYTMGGWVKDPQEKGRDMTNALEYLQNELGDLYGSSVFPLPVDTAFHSPILQGALPAYREAVNRLRITEPTKGRLVGASTVRELITPDDIREELVSQLVNVEDFAGATDLLIHEYGVTKVTELNEVVKLAGMIRRGYTVKEVVDGVEKDKMGKIDEIRVPGDGPKIVIARRWHMPVPVMAGGAGETRGEIRDYYFEYVADRTGLKPGSEDLNGETKFMEAFGGESVEIIAMRQSTGKRFGGVKVDDERVGQLETIDMAVEELYHLLNPDATDYVDPIAAAAERASSNVRIVSFETPEPGDGAQTA